jgi:SCY1-like protein 2
LQHSHYILHHILTFADILPIIALGLSSPTHAVVDAALSTLPAVLPVLDYSTIKNELFPVIAGVFAHTNSLGIKIRGLEAFYTLCGGTAENDSISDGLDGVSISHDSSKLSSSQVLDKFTIQEKVVPMMKGIKTKVSLIIEHKRSTLANCSRWLHSRCSDK